MSGLIRAEWLRLRRRKDLWIVLAALAALTTISYWGPLSSIDSHFGFDPTQPVPAEVLAQMAAERAQFAFPQSLLTVLGSGQIFLLALIAFATAGTLAAEFVYGTVRTSLVASSNRRAFLAVRIGAMALLAVLLLAVVVIVGAVMPLVGLAVGLDLPGGHAIDAAGFAALVGSLFLFSLVVIGLVSVLTVLFRNSGIALILAFAYVLLENIAVSRWATQTDAVATAIRLLPSSDLQLLLQSARFAAHPVALPFDGSSQALPPGTPATIWLLLVGIGWALAFLLAALAVFDRADINE
jgi:ABC-type transport system involved in multi-copper enzyme maturation permease subunit